MNHISGYNEPDEEYPGRNTDQNEIWQRIKDDLNGSRKELIKWLSVTSVVIIITSASFYYTGKKRLKYLNYYNSGYSIKQKTDLKITETEIYYNTLINELYLKALPFLSKHPEIKKELSDDLLNLENIYVELKDDLHDNINNEEVIEAMVNNYRIRTDLLENILGNVTDKTDNQPDNNYEL
ncbi:MAG TPA: hypothetical protein PLR52_01565 [Bacteroidales bacterium]|nr:hypothetical protein [Bacteroidales bacterium]HPI67988.1 hypothetical protein [Bacteroidales bacterium]HPR72433.1 hypothetical protein [Bacteroidales bacterium]